MKKVSRPDGDSSSQSLDLPWGAHACQIYRSNADILDVLIPFLQDGLENHERCLWILPSSLKVEEALKVLRQEIRNFDVPLERGQIEILPGGAWELQDDRARTTEEILKLWAAKTKDALHQGFEGLRVAVDIPRKSGEDREALLERERALDEFVGRSRVKALCTYSFDKGEPVELAEILSVHQEAVLKARDDWQRVGSGAARTPRRMTETRQAQRLLRESEEAYRSIFEVTETGMVQVAPDAGQFIRVNRRFCEITGYPLEELLGKAALDLTHPEDREKDAEGFRRLREGAISAHVIDKRYVRKDGSVIWVHANAALVRDAQDRALYVIESVLDITERKRAEDILRRNEERFRVMADVLPQILWTAGPDGAVDFYNDRWFQYTGLSREAGHGWNWQPVVHPEDADKTTEAWARALAQGETYEVEHRIRRADGAYRWFLSRGAPLRDAGGAIVKWIGTATDIQDWKTAEDHLRQERLLLQRVMDTNPSLIFVKDWDGKFTLVNKATAEIYGTTVEELVGKGDADFNSNAEEVRHFLQDDREVMRTGQTKLIPEEPVTNARTGETRWFQTTKVPMPVGSDGWLSVLGVAVDITAHRHAEESLRQNNERLRLLTETSQHFLGRGETRELLTRLYERLAPALELDAFFQFSLQPNERVIRLDAYGGITEEQAKSVETLELGEAVCGTVALERRPMVLGNIAESTDPRTAPLRAVGVTAYVCHPLFDHGRLIGTLSFGSRRRAAFRPDEVDFLKAVCDLVALALSRRQAEERLQQSQTNLAAAQKIARLGSWELDLSNLEDLNRNELRWSEEVFRIFGLDPAREKPSNELFFRGVPPEDKERIINAVGKTIREKTPYSLEHRIHRPDGTERYVHERGELVVDGTGRPLRIVGTVQDVTDQRRDQEALRESEEHFRTLADNIAQLAWMADEKGSIFWYNKRWFDFTGTTLEEMQGSGWQKVHHPEHVQRVTEKYLRRLKAGETWEDTFPLRRKDGAYRWFLSRAIPIRDAQGKVHRWFGTNTDVTEQREIEQSLARKAEELSRSNADLEHFAYVASHDLQEPLRMVSSYVQLLERRYKDKLDADAQEFIHYAADGAQRMQVLIQDLLSYSRVNTQGQAFRRVEMSAAVNRAKTLLHATIAECRGEVTAGELPAVLGDETQIMQLLQNLIGNALKYRRPEEPPRIHIAADARYNEWVFSVRDNGIGIDPQFKERIFVIFQRLHGRGQYSGTGIGLAICKRIVERHGGRIWVESQAGEGATFYFTLPAA